MCVSLDMPLKLFEARQLLPFSFLSLDVPISLKQQQLLPTTTYLHTQLRQQQ